MAEVLDPFWQAAANHVAASGVAAGRVFASTGFEALMPGCLTIRNVPDLGELGAVIIHKGRLEDVPPDILLGALHSFSVTFANEVFLVFAKDGTPLPPDNPHLMQRDDLLAEALRASHRKIAEPSTPGRAGRMPATYVGKSRVLLETAFGHLMLVDGGDTSIVPHLIRDGLFDRYLTDAFPALIGPGMVCMDIGANFGTYALIVASLVGDTGRVIAVEPVPRIAALLTETLTMNGFGERCTIVACAVGAQQGTVTMHEFAARQGGNTLHAHVAAAAAASYGEQVVTREVACRTLDDLVAEWTPDRLDFVKVDVEGFEHQVFSGGRETLRRLRPRLLLEWHNAFFGAGVADARALHDLLAVEMGYALHRIEAGGKTRVITFDELMELGHSDLLAEPLV